MQKEHSTEAEVTAESLSTDKLRAEFEAWALSQNYSLARFTKQHEGYASTATNAALHAYQAASASRAELFAGLRMVEQYLSPRVTGTGGDGEKRVLPLVRALIAKHGS